jgi:hypothetical protein
MKFKKKLTRGPFKGKTVEFNDTLPPYETSKSKKKPKGAYSQDVTGEFAYNAVCKLSYDILDNIIAPAMGLNAGDIVADCNMADIDVYTMDNPKLEKKILTAIYKRYKIKKGCYRYNIITTHMPLNLMALIILGEKE